MVTPEAAHALIALTLGLLRCFENHRPPKRRVHNRFRPFLSPVQGSSDEVHSLFLFLTPVPVSAAHRHQQNAPKSALELDDSLPVGRVGMFFMPTLKPSDKGVATYPSRGRDLPGSGKNQCLSDGVAASSQRKISLSAKRPATICFCGAFSTGATPLSDGLAHPTIFNAGMSDFRGANLWA